MVVTMSMWGNDVGDETHDEEYSLLKKSLSVSWTFGQLGLNPSHFVNSEVRTHLNVLIFLSHLPCGGVQNKAVKNVTLLFVPFISKEIRDINKC